MTKRLFDEVLDTMQADAGRRERRMQHGGERRTEQEGPGGSEAHRPPAEQGDRGRREPG